ERHGQDEERSRVGDGRRQGEDGRRHRQRGAPGRRSGRQDLGGRQAGRREDQGRLQV
ncbi:MAG: hypothetical protein AVDCRST_MAG36-2016, partial [uncultured Nocardioidaceae bacterium]